MKKIILIIIFLAVVATLYLYPYLHKISSHNPATKALQTVTSQLTSLNPLSIQYMRNQTYPGSQIKIEQTLPDGSNYHQYIASYQSDGLKIYALLAIPIGTAPKGGWPIIVFNHGYIPADQYQTNPSVGQYASYFPVFAENGYVVFKPDYRGNGDSQGQPTGAYYSPGYTIDDLHAITSIKKLTDPNDKKNTIVNPNKLGVWGHSMGGNITLRDLVIDPKDIKVAVIWGGVVGSYEDMTHWHDPYYRPSEREQQLRNQTHSGFQLKFGTPSASSVFWQSIDPTFYVKDITAPVQLDVGGADEEVPPSFSQSLYDKLKADNKTVEIYTYPGDNHNISNNFTLAMQRSVDFFDKYLK